MVSVYHPEQGQRGIGNCTTALLITGNAADRSCVRLLHWFVAANLGVVSLLVPFYEECDACTGDRKACGS